MGTNGENLNPAQAGESSERRHVTGEMAFEVSLEGWMGDHQGYKDSSVRGNVYKGMEACNPIVCLRITSDAMIRAQVYYWG